MNARTLRPPHTSTLVVAAGFVVAMVVAVLVGTGQRPYDEALDPRNPDSQGGQALARVLEEQGVEVEIVRSAAALEKAQVEDSTTVLVTGTDHLSPSTLKRLRTHAAPGRLVLVDAYRAVEEIGEGWGAVQGVPVDTQADCADGQGTVPGPPGVDLAGLRLQVDAGTAYTG
ncbi:MAG: DUF4350 domain-containing protein, partial [Nocardioidaceae bacterium]|nr:DUF4350 domain-containing protein [Nocardioidaceae bacterium]